MKGCNKRYLDCNILPKYTCSGAMPGLQAEHTGDFGKGWTNEGIQWFNALFDKGKEDQINNLYFIMSWLAKETPRSNQKGDERSRWSATCKAWTVQW